MNIKKLKEKDFKQYIKDVIEKGEARVFAVSDIQKNELSLAFKLPEEIIIIDEDNFEKKLSKDDYAIFNDEKVISLYKDNFELLYNKIYSPLHEIYNDAREYLGIETPTKNLIINNKNLVNAEISREDAKILKILFEKEEIEAVFAQYEKGVYVYINKEDATKANELMEKISKMPEEEKSDIDNFTVVLSKKVKKEVNRKQELLSMQKSCYENYLKDKAAGLEAMTDEELVGFKEEINSFKGPLVADNSHINDQIYEENLSEVETVHSTIKTKCEEKGLSYSEPGDMDAKVYSITTTKEEEDEYTERTLF